jgi:CubicO group peptidase (beta-lactamase class C family)
MVNSLMKWKHGLGLALLIPLVYGIRYGYQYAQIGAAYNAKMTCSCLFISGRPLESIESEDLYAIPFASQTVDYEHKMVTSSIYGIRKKAFFRPGLGCTIINNDIDAIKASAHDFQPPLINTESLEVETVLADSIHNSIQQTFDWAFTDIDTLRPVRTRAAMVLYDGKLVAERYAPGIGPETALIGWSMTKSITNALIGILVQDQRLQLHQQNLFSEWSDNRRQISLDQLLRMSSGLDFEENYSKVSDATRMLFSKPGAGHFALQSRLAHPPDSHWNYSSGTSNILQVLIRRQFPDSKSYLEFPHRRLFSKLGLTSAIMEPDADGIYVGSSYMFASARDWAILGQLFLQDGLWKGEQILPPGWAAYSSTVTPASDGEYGAHFWTYPRKSGLPADTYLMDGFEGQHVVIIPSQKLVIVRLGCTPGNAEFDSIRFFKEISDLFAQQIRAAN